MTGAILLLSGFAVPVACGGEDPPKTFGKTEVDASAEAAAEGGAGDSGGEAGQDAQQPPADGGCVPRTCSQLGVTCGSVLDPCGDAVECGNCPAGEVCGAAGPNQCGAGECKAKTCKDLAVSCGKVSDECGAVLDCGACQTGETCGGGGIDHQCGCTCKLLNATSYCEGGVCSLMGCLPGYADCNQVSGDGCEVATGKDPDHCGGCGQGCSFAHAEPLCEQGACKLGQCEAGWADCNAAASDGCEVLLNSDLENCGVCGKVCPGPAGTTACVKGECAASSCPPGTGDCDGLPGNGCETDLTTPANCGMCGNACSLAHASAACNGKCVVAQCDVGYGNCDQNQTNGCETLITSSTSHCGQCGNACSGAPNAAPVCFKSICLLACEPGFGDCDGAPYNGCETSLASNLAHCGQCNKTCSLNHAQGSCVAGACSLGFCDKGWADCNLLPGDGCETDIYYNFANCGGCNNVCPQNYSCSSGKCVCDSPCGTSCCGPTQQCCPDDLCAPLKWPCPDPY